MVIIFSYLPLDKMDFKLKWCYVFFVIISSYNCVVVGGTSKAAASLRYSKNHDGTLETAQKHAEDDNHLCNCNYSSGADPNVRKNIEEIVRVLLKDSLASRLETVVQWGYDVDRDVRYAADEIALQLALSTWRITSKIDSALKEYTILESLDKINKRQSAMENNLHACIVTNEAPNHQQNNRIQEINELGEKVTFLSKNTKRPSDRLDSTSKDQFDSIELVKSRLIALENATKVEHDCIRNLMSITENIQKSTVKSHPALEFPMKNATGVELDASMSPSCVSSLNVQVPSSVRADPGAWKDKEVPAADDLDNYMAAQTGCTYTGLEYNQLVELKPTATFDGSSFEWRVGVRTQLDADLGIWWGSVGYSLFIGQQLNTVSSFREWSSGKVWEHLTPGVLSPDRYVPFYIKISNGTMSLGNECESAPYFSHEVVVQPGEELHMIYKGWSTYGVKYLHNCPAK